MERRGRTVEHPTGPDAAQDFAAIGLPHFRFRDKLIGGVEVVRLPSGEIWHPYLPVLDAHPDAISATTGATAAEVAAKIRAKKPRYDKTGDEGVEAPSRTKDATERLRGFFDSADFKDSVEITALRRAAEGKSDPELGPCVALPKYTTDPNAVDSIVRFHVRKNKGKSLAARLARITPNQARLTIRDVEALGIWPRQLIALKAILYGMAYERAQAQAKAEVAGAIVGKHADGPTHTNGGKRSEIGSPEDEHKAVDYGIPNNLTRTLLAAFKQSFIMRNPRTGEPVRDEKGSIIYDYPDDWPKARLDDIYIAAEDRRIEIQHTVRFSTERIVEGVLSGRLDITKYIAASIESSRYKASNATSPALGRGFTTAADGRKYAPSPLSDEAFAQALLAEQKHRDDKAETIVERDEVAKRVSKEPLVCRACRHENPSILSCIHTFMSEPKSEQKPEPDPWEWSSWLKPEPIVEQVEV